MKHPKYRVIETPHDDFMLMMDLHLCGTTRGRYKLCANKWGRGERELRVMYTRERIGFRGRKWTWQRRCVLELRKQRPDFWRSVVDLHHATYRAHTLFYVAMCTLIYFRSK